MLKVRNDFQTYSRASIFNYCVSGGLKVRGHVKKVGCLFDFGLLPSCLLVCK